MSSVMLVACNNAVKFTTKSVGIPTEIPTEIPSDIPTENPTTDDPQTPTPTNPTDPVQPTLNLKSGSCPVGQEEKLLSCLHCQSKAAEPAPSLLSRKAQELLDIMTEGCSIRNASDPAGYRPPTREQILKRLIQCSPTLYPDTNFVGSQKFTIEALLKKSAAQHSAFGGLYYNWASTDFETYFGFEIAEARYTLCRGDVTFKPGGVYPREYYDALYQGVPYTLPSQWKKAQVIRENLRRCMAESLRNPNPTQLPGKPAVNCSYETAEGDMSRLVVEKAQAWMQQGHQVYFEGFNMCAVLENPESLLDKTGPVKIAVKMCSEGQ